MEDQIELADEEFFDFFNEEGERELDVKAYIGKKDEDRFSLASLTELDPNLLCDKHFTQMFQDMERYLSPEFIKKAKHVDRYYVLISNILQGLLRSTGSTFDPKQRKQMIEEVYAWYRQKRKLLLGFRVKKEKKKGQPSYLKKLERHITESDEREAAGPVKPMTEEEKLEALLRDQSDPFATPATPTTLRRKERRKKRKARMEASLKKEEDIFPEMDDMKETKRLPNFVNKEKKKQMFINNKIKQYARRDLKSSQQARENKGEVEEGKKKVRWMQRPSTVGQGMEQSRFLPYKRDHDEFKNTRLYGYWLEHRAAEAMDHLEEQKFKDTVNMWSFNRARVEEEIYRRQESSRYSSQTGHHAIGFNGLTEGSNVVRYSPKQLKNRKQFYAQKLHELRENQDSFLDTDSDFSEDEEEEAKPTDSPSQDTPTEEENDFEPTQEEKPTPNRIPTIAQPSPEKRVFLTPYSNLNKVTGQFIKPEATTPSYYLMKDEERKQISKGFIRPTTTGSSSIPRTPIIGYHREWIKKEEEETTEEQIKRPQTHGGYRGGVEFFQNQQKVASPLHHVAFTQPDKVHFHSIYDTDGLLDDGKKKKKKGGKKGGKKGSKKGGKKGGKKGDKKEEAKPEEPAPYVEPPVVPQPPSLLRSAQLDEVEQIKVSLAKNNLNVPRSVIERSILIPEDRSYEACQTTLPTHHFLFLQNVCPVKETKKKKKKGKKKKKKKK